jgi:hypothetical protein
MTQRSTRGLDAAVTAVLTHSLGTLRIWTNADGRLWVEVYGFLDDDGRTFLRALAAQLEDVIGEILVHDRPEEYGLVSRALGARRGHRRRSSP